MIFSLRVQIFIIILFIATQDSFANINSQSNTKTENTPQVPLINGISTRLVPQQSETITFPETYFSFGIYHEFLSHDTKNNYDPAGLGVILGFDQHIRGMWSGGIEMRWSDWKAKTASSLVDTSPLSIYSKMTAAPNLGTFFKNEDITQIVRPYLSGGFGYMFFFDNRSLLAAKSKTALGQISATYGGGFKLILPASFSIKLGAEQWRGLQTSDYFANVIFLELSFGDVDKF